MTFVAERDIKNLSVGKTKDGWTALANPRMARLEPQFGRYVRLIIRDNPMIDDSTSHRNITGKGQQCMM